MTTIKTQLYKTDSISYMFRPPRGHHQGDIQNVSGSVHIIYGREISLLQIMLQVNVQKTGLVT